jgi:iron complex outermembrane receptor protein
MSKNRLHALLAVTVSAIAIASASSAFAADAAAGAAGGSAPTMTGAGAEGTDIEGVVVTAESSRGAAEAPTKASLAQTQPESIISHKFIEQVTPETGGWTTVLAIAPSVSGLPTNGGGIGEYNVLSLRGFQDGEFNITYDGISFGDTNNPTHHSGSYWPASTIGAAVIDRGPGAAGDLGQANFGGAFHLFSPTVSDTFGVVQKLTYGSFNTEASVTTLNTGIIPEWHDAKLLLSFDERRSDGELSNSGGYALNQLGKLIMPITDKWTLTAFASRNYTDFNLSDAGPGETWQQVQAYGKNFALTNNPNDEHYYKYNYEAKATDFEYVDLKGEVAPTFTAENQLYTYFYANKTTSVDDITGLVGGPNTSTLSAVSAGEKASDIAGYDKLNQYRVWGDVVRLNKEWSFGTLKIGGLVETSSTDRHNLLEDMTAGGLPDLKYTAKANPDLGLPVGQTATNAKLQENSSWFQYQVFADFDWNVTDKLTLSPGIKFVDFKRTVSAADEAVSGATGKIATLNTSDTYTSPLYFITGKYRILPELSVYGQVATSFLIPALSDLYVTGANLAAQPPEKTITYQTGVVYSHGAITADADVYRIDATNFQAPCNIPNPTAGNASATEGGYCDVGNERFTGVEGQVAYAFNFGLSLFANGSINDSKQLAAAANPAQGTAATPAETLQNAPINTFAIGGLYNYHQWQGSLTYKQSGPFVASYNGAHEEWLSGYDTFDGSVAYDFGRIKVKLQGFNLLDKRAITSFTGSKLYSTTDTGLYQFQAGRQIMATLIAKVF